MRKWNSNLPEVPVDEHGNMLRQDNWKCGWKIMPLFLNTEMKIIRWSNTPSSILFTLEDSNGVTYPMSASNFFDTISKRSVAAGVIEKSKYSFNKVGNAYGIVPLDL